MASNTAATPTEGVAPPSTSSKGPVVCVFCGASPGTTPVHREAARSLAQAFHKHNISLVYGGGTAGLMGEVARTLTELSGPSAVHGIIPEAILGLEREFTGGDTENQSYGRTTVVSSMHTRKAMMAKEVQEGGPGSGFVALSGGYGTMEELMEMVTWNMLGIHGKGVVVLNVEGYWDGLLQWVRTAVGAGFVSSGNGGILKEALDAEEVVTLLRDYKVSEDQFKLDWSQK